MSDDFGTINARRGERAREIEVLRQHYRQHRDALARMVADAPTEHLASEYQRLIAEIDRALGKLDELEGRPATAAAVPPPQHEPTRPHGDPLAAQRPTASGAAAASAGMRPLAGHAADLADPPTIPPENDGYTYAPPRSRMALILGAAVLALAVIGWLIWRASSDRDPAAGAIVEETTTTAPTTAPATVAEPVNSELSVTPPSHEYGTIRRGTRAVRQFEVTNNTDEPVTIQIARSACRCLYYDYTALVPPRAKETVTVTVDAAKAKGGALRETVRVTAKSDPAVGTSFDVIATIQ
jgi:hypothetical protein